MTRSDMRFSFQIRQAGPAALVLIDEIRKNLAFNRPIGSPGRGYGPELPLALSWKDGNPVFHFEGGASVEVQMHEIGQYNLMQENQEWVTYGAILRYHPAFHLRTPKVDHEVGAEELKNLWAAHPFGGARITEPAALTGSVLVGTRYSHDRRIYVDPLLAVLGDVEMEFKFSRLVKGDKRRAIAEAVAYAQSHTWGNRPDQPVSVVVYPPKGRMTAHQYLNSAVGRVVETYPKPASKQ